MRHSPPLLPLLTALALSACGAEEPVAAPPEPVPVAEPATPPPAPDGSRGGLLPQEPLPEGTAPPRRGTSRQQPAARASTSPAAADLPALRVEVAQLAERVVDRRPVGVATTFPEGSEVYCFMRVANSAGVKRPMAHRWRHEDRTKSKIDLSVGGPSWRTWTSLPVWGKGKWSVEILDDRGDVLTTLRFTVE